MIIVRISVQKILKLVSVKKSRKKEFQEEIQNSERGVDRPKFKQIFRRDFFKYRIFLPSLRAVFQ